MGSSGIGTKVLVCAAVLAASAADGAERLQEYLFEVPVSIANVDPRITEGSVTCEVVAQVIRPRGDKFPPEERLGGATATFSVAKGRFEGVVPVRFYAAYEVIRGARYACRLDLAPPDGPRAIACVKRDEVNCHPEAWARLDPATLKAHVSGELPDTGAGSEGASRSLDLRPTNGPLPRRP